MADPTATPKDALRDAAGKRHPPAGPGARIVSLVPSITELIVDLGLGDQLVGRTHYCVHPADGTDRDALLAQARSPRIRMV